MKLSTASYLLITLLLFQNCAKKSQLNEKTVINIEFIDQYVIPFGFEIDQTEVGGLSSLDLASDEIWYVVSDDKSEFFPARFYKIYIDYSLNGIDTVIFKNTVYLKNKIGEKYEKNTVDPEAIRYNSQTQSLFYSSEGGRIDGVKPPFIREMDTLGYYIKEYNVPKIFDFYNDKKGLRDNGTLESLAFANDSILWFANELPLIEDGLPPRPEETISPVRLTKLDIKNNLLLEQYAYMLDPVHTNTFKENDFNVNSVVELLVLSDSVLLVMERSYVKDKGNAVKIFRISLEDATEISSMDSLKGKSYKAVKKELILDFADYGERIGNIEGMSFGKDFPDGRRSLVCVSDNNFNEDQQTQFWLFAIDGL